MISKGGCLFKKISSLISSERRFQARKYMTSFMKKIQFLTDKCPSNKLAIANTNFAHEIDYSRDL